MGAKAGEGGTSPQASTRLSFRWYVLMADWGAALIARLEARATLVALLGPAGVDWGKLPQGEDMPGVALFVVSDVREDHYQGEQGLRRSHVQADCLSARSAEEASRIAEELMAAVRPEPGQEGADAGGGWVSQGVQFYRPAAEGPVDSGEQKDLIYVHRARVDLHLWHVEEGE